MTAANAQNERIKRLEKRVERLEALVVWMNGRGRMSAEKHISTWRILRFNEDDVKRLSDRAEELMSE